MPKPIPSGLSRWPSEIPRFFLGGHLISDPESLFQKYGKIDIQSLPIAETQGRSASDMALGDIEKIQADRAREQDIASKYEALSAKFGGQIPTSEYEKVFPPGGQAPAPAAQTPQGQQYGGILTLPNGQRIHPDDPNYATYAEQLGVQKAVTPITPSETPGVISSTNDPFKQLIADAQKTNQQAIALLTAPQPQLPNAPTALTIPELPDVSKIGKVETPQITPETSPEIQAIDLRRQQLQAEKTAATLDIENKFEQQRRETEETQRGNLEFFKALAAGNFGLLPQNSTQYIQFYTDSINKNQRALLDITNAETREINAANRAYSQGDFDLLEKKIATMTQMRASATELERFNTELALKKASLSLDITRFQNEAGISAANLSLKEMEIGIARARELREQGMDNFEIGVTIQRELREEKAAELKYTQSLVESLAPSLVGVDDSEIIDVADDYNIDANTLIAAVRKQELTEQKEQFAQELDVAKLEEEKRQADISNKLLQAKFEEDRRQFGLSYALNARKVAIDEQTKGGGPIDTNKTIDQINLLKNSINNAKKLAYTSGRSGIKKLYESWFVGSTDYTNLVAETNTLRTNILTLMTDPAIKKFFGPQMSNADVQLMTSAGTTLNPELQHPEKLTQELSRIQNLIFRMESAIRAQSFQLPDGTIVNLQSDGTYK